jgi:hypothetical protein
MREMMERIEGKKPPLVHEPVVALPPDEVRV